MKYGVIISRECKEAFLLFLLLICSLTNNINIKRS